MPIQAVLREDEGTYVYLIQEGDTARRQDVKIGSLEGNRARIASGISEGDRVIVRGTDLVEDGKPVRPVETPP